MTSLADLESWFSADRLAPYHTLCIGDGDRATELYAWNAELSAALWRTLGHVEVLIRNALHYELARWSDRRYGTERWYLAIDGFISDRTHVDIQGARRRATRNGRAETAGRVVAELNLGFWRYLIARRYDGTLWRYCLFRAFPGRRRADVERAIADLHVLRNRIGHHEPIHNRPIAELLTRALAVADWINPAAREWIAAGDTSRELLAKRP